MEQKTCFILMPFSKTDDLAEEDLTYIYTHILQKATTEYRIEEKQYFKLVERYSSKIGSLIDGIVNNLNTADLVIADLTGLNPNVMYELGVRHSLKRGTIIISQHLEKLPSDLRDYLTVGYRYSQNTKEQVANYERFKVELHKTIDEVVKTKKSDSPVLNYLGQKQRFRNEEEIDKLKENVVIIGGIAEEYHEIQDIISALEETNYTTVNRTNTQQVFILKLNNIITGLNELRIPYNSSLLYESIRNSKTLLGEVIKMFGMSEMFSAFGPLAEMPTLLTQSNIKDLLEKKFINLYDLVYKGVEYVNVKDLFKENGIIETELLDELEAYVEKRSKELGIEELELQKLLTS